MAKRLDGIDHLLVRRDHVLCTICAAIEPINVGDGMPVPTFILALQRVGRIHNECEPAKFDDKKFCYKCRLAVISSKPTGPYCCETCF